MRLISFFLSVGSLLLLPSCEVPPLKEKRVFFEGRIPLLAPVYRAQVPLTWKQKERLLQSQESTLPIAEFLIEEEGANAPSIRITIHNFPKEEGSVNIPAELQVARWQKQLKGALSFDREVTQESRGGFFGLRFEGEGLIEGKQVRVVAWAMNLALLHDNILKSYQHEQPNLSAYLQEMRADYTIKAVGPPDLMKKHYRDIVRFAHSFELIEEIPRPL